MFTINIIGTDAIGPDTAELLERLMDRREALTALPTAAVSGTVLEINTPAPATARTGERYAGIVLDDSGQPTHHLFLLEAKPSGTLNWAGAREWAAGLEASLPTRFEAALLYANLRGQFETSDWYWTDTQYSESHAWVQNFYDGNQDTTRKDVKFLARAVRRLPL